MKKIIIMMCTIALLAGGMATPAGAALNAVGPVVVATGFPLWYEDANLLRLEQCLIPGFICNSPELTLPNPLLPLSTVVPGNFPLATFYYSATAKIADPAVDATLILSIEGNFAPLNTAVVPGQQGVFARIRFTINPRTAATANVPFTVTHPFGSVTVTTRGIGQRLLISQDIPGVIAGNFTGALLDSPAGGIVNATGASLGPFLTAAPPALNRIVLPTGTFLSDGVTLVNLTGSPLGTNTFSLVGGGVVVTEPTFTLVGKVSGCAATNTAPIAAPDTAAAASGQAQAIPVITNDVPGVPATPLNPASIAVTVPPAHGTATPNPDGTVTYTPAAAFAGADSFTYTVQDNCGLASNPVVVGLTVENLVVDKAEFRARNGKWTISGQSSAPAGSSMTLHKGDVAGPVIGATTVQADSTFKFSGKSKTPPGSPTAVQPITAQSAATVTTTKVLKMQ